MTADDSVAGAVDKAVAEVRGLLLCFYYIIPLIPSLIYYVSESYR